VKPEKPGKPTGKEDELRMSADEFDRIMGKVLGVEPPKPLGSEEPTPAKKRPVKSED
jgi:hypothetical protein